MGLTKADILNARLRNAVTVDTPEWGGSVKVVCMTGKQRSDFFELSDTPHEALARAVAGCTVDENGDPLFSIDDATDIMNNTDGVVFDRVALAVMQLSGLFKDSVEEAEKNSDGNPNG